MGSVVLFMLVGFLVFTAIALVRLVVAWKNSEADDLLVDIESEAEELATLAVTKARLLQDIRDLEFDFQTGHLSEADYEMLRTRLEKKAIAAMKKLDSLHGDKDYDTLIDRGYSERFGVDPVEAPGSALDPDEDDDEASSALDTGTQPAAVSPKSLPSTARDGSQVPCPSCAYPMEAGASFCSSCGTSMPEPEVNNLDCTSCGEELDDDAKFCKHCGTPVEASADQTVTSSDADNAEVHDA